MRVAVVIALTAQDGRKPPAGPGPTNCPIYSMQTIDLASLAKGSPFLGQTVFALALVAFNAHHHMYHSRLAF